MRPKERIGHLYPKVKIRAEMTKDRPDLREYVGKKLTVIAWLWARTIECPNPACSAKTPISKTFALSGKKGNEAYAVPIIESQKHQVHFRVARGEDASREGNVNRRGANCLLCGTPISLDHIRDEATAGRMGQQLMAIVVEGRRNRVYVSPTPDQIAAANAAEPDGGMDAFDEPAHHALGFRVQRYGMTSHAALFSRRQIVALSTFADLVREIARESRVNHSS